MAMTEKVIAGHWEGFRMPSPVSMVLIPFVGSVSVTYPSLMARRGRSTTPPFSQEHYFSSLGPVVCTGQLQSFLVV